MIYYPSFSRACIEATAAVFRGNFDLALKLAASATSIASQIDPNLVAHHNAPQRLDSLERHLDLSIGAGKVRRPSRGEDEHVERFAPVISQFMADTRRGEPSLLRGTLPWRCRGMNELLPQVLGVSSLIAPFAEDAAKQHVDFFCTWGITENSNHNLARKVALSEVKPLLSLEYGLISSADIALKESPQHSLIVSPGAMYYDAARISYIEARLNNPHYTITGEQRRRARHCIDLILKTQVTKYNHAPVMDLATRGFDVNKKRILVVDQRYGDASIPMGLVSQATFGQMLESALAHEDHEILVKIHPDALTGGKRSSLSEFLERADKQRIKIIDFDVNPYSLFKIVSKVFVCVSQIGLEALLAGKEVHCFGVPFYAGWGLTVDHRGMPRPRRKRSLEEVFHVCYLESSSYGLSSGPCELEDLIAHLDEACKRRDAVPSGESPPAPSSDSGASEGRVYAASAVVAEDLPAEEQLRIVFLLPSGRFGASGRYFQDLAFYMQKHGVKILVLAEGDLKPHYSGVAWRAVRFGGMFLEPSLMAEILAFKPNFVYENGVRSRSQRAALEIVARTGAKLVMQSEDDDIQVYCVRHPRPDPEFLKLLDRPSPSATEVAEFLGRNDWLHTVQTWMDPSFDRWVEPVLRAMCYHIAVGHTAIWYPFAERLKKEFGKPTIVVPPATNIAKIKKRAQLTQYQVEDIRKRIGVPESSLMLFLGGTVYDYSDEYPIFIQSLALAASQTSRKLALVVVSGRTNLNLDSLSRSALPPQVAYINLGAPDDTLYEEVLCACDVVCAPGVVDDFNRYRLPSRLVKAMGAGKAIFTFGVGFGESLRHGENAFLTRSDDPAEWASVLVECADDGRRSLVARNAVKFAQENFDATQVADGLIHFFRSLQASAPEDFSRR